MKKLGYLLPILAIALMLGGTAFASVEGGDNSVYFVTYYSNANTSGAPDGTLRIVNDGDVSNSETEGVPNGYMWADIYVFDDSQELQECCSCFVSPDGLLSESVNKNLTANELTGRAENTRGVIKVLSSPNNNPTAADLAPGLRGTMTHVQAGATKATWAVTEVPIADSNFNVYELESLEQSCSFAITLGSGYGTCSCTEEDHDF